MHPSRNFKRLIRYRDQNDAGECDPARFHCLMIGASAKRAGPRFFRYSFRYHTRESIRHPTILQKIRDLKLRTRDRYFRSRPQSECRLQGYSVLVIC